MFVDSRKLSHGSEVDTDVCIVGAGPAGITMAKEFINQNFQVCLLEGGDINIDEDTASLGDGEICRRSVCLVLRDMRRRQFGGIVKCVERRLTPIQNGRQVCRHGCH